MDAIVTEDNKLNEPQVPQNCGVVVCRSAYKQGPTQHQERAIRICIIHHEPHGPAEPREVNLEEVCERRPYLNLWPQQKKSSAKEWIEEIIYLSPGIYTIDVDYHCSIGCGAPDLQKRQINVEVLPIFASPQTRAKRYIRKRQRMPV